MANAAPPDLEDARALLARARKHYAELNALLHPQKGNGLWWTSEVRDQTTGEWSYSIHMNRQMLIEAKPIIADSATNVWSALDNVAAAIAKSNGYDRLFDLKFPWGFADADFEKAQTRFRTQLGQNILNVFKEVRCRHPVEIHHVEAVREISNSGKHWELLFAIGTAHAVALHIAGEGQRMFQVPANAFEIADSYEFHRASDKLPIVEITMVLGLEIRGLTDGLPASPDALECSFRYVQSVIESVSAAA
jgi:hypothetical protein